MYLLRSWWDHLRFRARLRARFVLDLLLLALGIGLLFFGGNGVPDMIGWAATAAGALLFGRDLRDRMAKRDRTQVVENGDYAAQIAKATLLAGYRSAWAVLPVPKDVGTVRVADSRPYVTSDAVNALIDGASNPLVRADDVYQVPDQLAEYRERCVGLKRPGFNQPKIGLRTDMTEAVLRGNRPLRIQRTDYFSGVATNEMACQRFEACRNDRRGRPEPLLAVSSLVIGEHGLVNLSDSSLSNHIGVSTLVVTADGYLVLQDQGDQMVSGYEAGLGASGSVDWKDLAATGPAPTLQALIRHAMQREAREELSATFVGPQAGTWLTGHARYLARGGKPEFFGISRTDKDFDALHATRADQRYVAGIYPREIAPDGLLSTIDALLREGRTARPPYSPSMVVCLHMARDHLMRGGPAGTWPAG